MKRYRLTLLALPNGVEMDAVEVEADDDSMGRLVRMMTHFMSPGAAAVRCLPVECPEPVEVFSV